MSDLPSREPEARQEPSAGAQLPRQPAPAPWARSRARSLLASRWADVLIALVLGGVTVALLLATVRDLGYARDEGFYFSAARHYGQWFDLLFAHPEQALARSSVDRYWQANSEHPAFVKSLFALSDKVLYRQARVFAEEGTAFRFPGMVLGGLGVSIVYLWSSRVSGRLAGVVAATLLAMMPRIFYHAHLDCFDVPVLTMWLVTTYAYWRSVDARSGAWALATGVLYGLLLNTKHNAWLLPPALVLHFLLTSDRQLGRELLRGQVRVPLALVCMATLGPLVFYSTWPWIWNDTAARLTAYVRFHTQHAYYNMEFLGHTFWKPPMPRLYAWVMTVATVPAITLLLFVLGVGLSLRDASLGRVRFWLAALRQRRQRPRSAEPLPGSAEPSRVSAPASLGLLRSALSPSGQRAFATRSLWLLCILTSYGPWLSSGTPIFGGTKHWITAYPFLCLFAGVGFAHVAQRLAAAVLAMARRGPWVDRLLRFGAVEAGLALCVVIGPVVMTLHSHPWGLSAYTPLVGGAPGAATLGLNRSFWGYTTGAVTGFLNASAAPGATVYIHDTAMDSWNMLVHDGRVRGDLHATLAPQDSSLGLYHHEQHMSRVEHQLWVLYGTTQPAYVGAYDGVPVIWVYQRPETPR